MINLPVVHEIVRCAVYTRKSTDDRFARDFNSIETQREVCAAYIKSQQHKGWTALSASYDDMAQSGGTLDRPALQRLMADVESGTVDVIVVYKIDRLTRSLADFVRLVDLLDRFQVAFVSITQSFDTSDSMGRLVLNVLLTFAQFEREMIADRIRDKVAAMKRRGQWTGGPPPFGYDVVDRKLVVNEAEADIVRHVYRRFLEIGSYVKLRDELKAQGLCTKQWTTRKGVVTGGTIVSSGMVYNMLASRFYMGDVPHFDTAYPGIHQAIVERPLWEAVQAQRAVRAMYKLDLGPSPNILLGIVVDGFGRPMTIADGNNKGKRYRYYISNQARWATRKGIKRVRAEANALERTVITALQTFLADQPRLRAALAPLGRVATLLDRLGTRGPEAARRLDVMTVEQRRLAMVALLARVELAAEHVDLQLRLTEIERFLAWDGKGIFRAGEILPLVERLTHLIRVPVAAVRFQRSIVMPVEPAPKVRTTKPVKALVALVREARRAQAAMDAERSASLAEIAARFERQPGIFARILRVNYLAPDIIAALLDGTQPPHLTRKKLVDANLPMDWAMQRRLFGFAERPNFQMLPDGRMRPAPTG